MNKRTFLYAALTAPIAVGCGASSAGGAPGSSSTAPSSSASSASASASASGAASGTAGSSSEGAPPSSSSTHVDLSFLHADDALTVAAGASDATKRFVVRVDRGLRTADPMAISTAALSGALDGARALVIEGGCVQAVITLPSRLGPTATTLSRSAEDAELAEEAEEAASLSALQRDFAPTPRRDLDGTFAWTAHLGLMKREANTKNTLLVTDGTSTRVVTLAAKHVETILVTEDGRGAFAGLGFFGDPGSGSLAQIDLTTGALAPVPGKPVRGIARVLPNQILVLRDDRATRSACFSRMDSSAKETPIGCLPQLQPATTPVLVTSADGNYAAAGMVGKKTRDGAFDMLVVVDLRDGHEVQRVSDVDLDVYVGPNGQIAMQQRAGVDAIRYASGGKLTALTHASLAGFDASGSILTIDDDAARAGNACGLVHSTAAPP